MKKLQIIIVGIFSLLGVYLGLISTDGTKVFPPVQAVESVLATKPGLPERLVIESISVDTVVEQVGIDQEKRMDVPKDVYNVGWYKYGPRPGEVGNVVIDGHYNTPERTPSIFYNLDKLVPGNKITVFDDKNNMFTYRVSEVTSYPVDNFPIKAIFGSSSVPRIVLITCGGEYDATAREFLDRVVVYGELVDSKKKFFSFL